MKRLPIVVLGLLVAGACRPSGPMTDPALEAANGRATKTIHGRSRMKSEFTAFMREHEDATHAPTIDEIIVAGDRAIERARYTLKYAPKAGQQPVIETGRHVMSRQWIDGRWQITWELFNRDGMPGR